MWLRLRKIERNYEQDRHNFRKYFRSRRYVANLDACAVVSLCSGPRHPTAGLGFAGFGYEMGDRYKVALLRAQTKLKLSEESLICPFVSGKLKCSKIYPSLVIVYSYTEISKAATGEVLFISSKLSI